MSLDIGAPAVTADAPHTLRDELTAAIDRGASFRISLNYGGPAPGWWIVPERDEAVMWPDALTFTQADRNSTPPGRRSTYCVPLASLGHIEILEDK